MMGTNYGYRPGADLPESDVRQKWAWLPLKSTSGKWIWREYYVILKVYQDKDGNVPKKGIYWNTVFTNNEYLVWQIKNPEPTPLTLAQRLPRGGSAIRRGPRPVY